ncbi:beta-1,3-glucanase family protein [Cysteiniphilum halobium]|uniref:beta-1,3-glucanase family protein n=1 Tax=Cysteiniphilum halobium TaxID=2219059 RepID=UPI003F86CDB6
MKVKYLSLAVSSLFIFANAFAASSAQDYATTLNTLANTPVTEQSNYFPVQIVDNLKDNNQQGITNAYLLMIAQQIPKVKTDPANACVMQFSSKNLDGTTVAVGHCVVPQVGEDIGQQAQALSTIPGYNANTHSVLVYIPKVQSGRAFLSLNHKLSMYALKTDNTISYQAPDDSNKQDPSYDIIYDKFEFTYGDDGVFWINPTSVDFFSIPISLIKYGTNETSGDLKASSGAPLNQTRAQIINAMNQTLDSAGGSWTKLLHTYDGTRIRIAAPHIAPDFPKDSYLNTYVTTFRNYYKTKTLTINCSELVGDASNPMPLGEKYGYVTSGADKGQPMYPANLYSKLYEFTGQVNDKNEFVFSNKAGVDQVNKAKGKELEAVTEKIDLSNTAQIAQGFFEPGQAGTAFATPNKTLQSVLVKNITAAWSVGLLTPSPQQDVSLSSSYFENNKSNYYQTGSYDVYAKAIHAVMPNTYAYAYDDVVKQDGTLNSNNNTQPVTIVFGDMSGINIPIPPPATQFHPATVTGIVDSQSNQDSLYCDGANCTTDVSFKAPAQKGVSYYPLAHNLFDNISSNDLAKKQAIVAGTNQGSGVQNYTATLTIPQEDVIGAPAVGSVGSVSGLKVQVFACSDLPGGNCPGITRAPGVGNPTSSAVYPKANVTVLPVTISQHTGYTCSGGSCSVTLKWTIPEGQGSNVQYYIGLQGYTLGAAAGFENGVYSLTTAGATTQTINVSYNDLNAALTQAQVFSCSTSNNDCPTPTNNYAPVNAAPGSQPIDLTPPTA